MVMDKVSEMFSGNERALDSDETVEEMAEKLKEEEKENSVTDEQSVDEHETVEEEANMSKLDEQVDNAFESTRDECKNIFSHYEKRQEQLQVKALEEAQKTVLKQMVGNIEDVIKKRHNKLEKEFTKALLNLEDQFQDRIEDNEKTISELTAKMDQKTKKVEKNKNKIEKLEEERKEQFEDVHDRIQSLQENVQENEEEIADRIKDNSSKIDDLESQILEGDYSELESRIDSIQDKLEDEEHEMTQIKDRFEEEDLVIDDTNVPKMEQKVKSQEKKIRKLQQKIEELEQIEIDTELKDQIVSQLRGEVKDTVYTPDEIGSKMKGRELTVKGRLQFKKKVSGRNFYKMTGSGGSIIVASKKKMPEGKKELTGEIENVKGNLCLVVD